MTKRPDPSESSSPPSGPTRRSFLKGAGGLAAGGAALQAAVDAAQDGAGAGGSRLVGRVEVTLEINGQERSVEIEPRTTLLSALRHHIEPPLTGTKLVCDQGTCGACTVLLDGEPVYSCLTLAADAVGHGVRTIEGLTPTGGLSPVQEAFWRKDATMCGFCTPGFVVSVTACLERNPEADRDEVRQACAGNLCRCGTYPHVFEAALDAGRRMRELRR